MTDAGTFVLCTLCDFRARGQSLHSPMPRTGTSGGSSSVVKIYETESQVLATQTKVSDVERRTVG